jgi:PAS domain S-box-containing protein
LNGSRGKERWCIDNRPDEPQARRPNDPSLDEIARLASLICGAEAAVLALKGVFRVWARSEGGVALANRMTDSGAWRALPSPDDVVVVPDTRGAPPAPPDVRFYAAVPLIGADGERLGTLSVVDTSPHALAPNQIEALRVLGERVTSRLSTPKFPPIEDSRHRYRLLFEDNPQPMWVYDVETFAFLAVNNAAVEKYGYSKDEFLRMTIKDIRPKEDVPALVKSVAEIESGFSVSENWRHRRKDGSLIEVEIVSHPVIFAGRKAEIVLPNDVTEKRRLEAQLRQTQKMEAVGRLAGGVAHDFNNLLSVILGFTELTLDRLPADSPHREALGEVLKAATHAAALTSQLLVFTRQQPSEPALVDVSVVVRDMAAMLERLVGREVTVETRLGRGLAAVRSDAGQIAQILINLCVNARDAMPHGGRLTIETSDAELDEAYARRHIGVRPGRYVMLAVSDTGSGMDPQTLSRIFEPFFTTKPAGKGTGLGLATVYAIVRQWGGTTWVYSEVGKGTVFKIYLPRSSEAVTADVVSSSSEALALGSETVLLVEDEDSVRELARELLTARGYTVLAAASAEEALSRYGRDSRPLDILVTDLVMPHMSGRELAKAFAALHPETKVLFMSGYSDLTNGVAEVEGHFLQKPFTAASLLKKVREILNAVPPG